MARQTVHDRLEALEKKVARLETRIALEALVRRFPHYEIDRPGVERFHSSNIRGLSKVPFAA